MLFLLQVFSSFGPIKSCHLIKDVITGFSKCYAFVEFENERSASTAYRSGNRIIIDDRKVLVDFECERLLPGWVPRRLGNLIYRRIYLTSSIYKYNTIYYIIYILFNGSKVLPSSYWRTPPMHHLFPHTKLFSNTFFTNLVCGVYQISHIYILRICPTPFKKWAH